VQGLVSSLLEGGFAGPSTCLPCHATVVEEWKASMHAQSFTDPQAVGMALSEYVSLGDWRLFFIYRDRLKKVTPADVQRVAGRTYRGIRQP